MKPTAIFALRSSSCKCRVPAIAITLLLAACLTILIGCGQSLSQLTVQQYANSPVSVATQSVRAGSAVPMSATKGGLAVTGGTWTVMGGPANGTISPEGLYTAPAVVPPDSSVIVSYLLNGGVTTASITLLNPSPSVTSVTPTSVNALATPLLVSGTGFIPQSSIIVNGESIQTAYIDAQHLSGSIVLSAAINTSLAVSVSSPAPGASRSNAITVSAIFGAKLSFATPSFFKEQSDEFVGPFPSWTNIKTTYGAIGDGIADDTAAIQRAIDALSDSSASCVLWLPNGTYKITSTLVFAHKHNFTVVGEDPGNTILKWTGAPGGTLLETDGSTFMRFSRLGLDGSGLAGTAETHTTIIPFKDAYYSTFNELSDLHIFGFKVGIRLIIDAETTIDRVFFDHLSTAGLIVGDFNTLNIFVNDSLFDHCGTGLSDAIDNGSGSYIVSNSYFVASQIADMSIANTGLFTARHNTSIGSKTFFQSYEIYQNSSQITLQNNTVIDPQTSPFMFGNLGPFMLIDNVVRLRNSNIPIMQASWTPTGLLKDVFSFGNIYTPNAGARTPGSSVFQGREIAYDDTIVPISSIPDITVPTNVYVPPNHHRLVIEAPDFTGDAIQSAINQAGASDTIRPVVHLRKGLYVIPSTIRFAKGSDVQLIGDDASTTILQWEGTGNKPVLIVPTSNVSLKYLGVSGYGTVGAEGILLNVADEPSTQIIADQVLASGGNQIGISFDGLEQANVELSSTYVSGQLTGVRVTGGTFRAAKEGTLGVTNHYSGSLQSEGTGTSFDVSSYGKYMVQDNWHDRNLTSPQNFKLNGSGTVTEQGGTVYMNSPKPFEIDDFEGNISLIGLGFTGGFQLSPLTKQTNLLNLGMVGDTDTYLPSSTGTVMVQNILDSYQGGHIEQKDTATAAWLRMMLAQTRSEYPVPRITPAFGASRIRLSRIAVLFLSTAIQVKPDTINKGLYYGLMTGSSMLGNTQDTCVNAGVTVADNQWFIMAAGEGDYELVSRKTGDALGFATSSNGGLTLEAVNGEYDQRWIIEREGDGSFHIVNRQTGGLVSLSNPGGCIELGGAGSTNWTITAY